MIFQQMNPPKFECGDDMANLTYLNERFGIAQFKDTIC